MQQPEFDFIRQLYRDLKVALEKSKETQLHLLTVKEIIDSLTNNLNELNVEFEKNTNPGEKRQKELKADCKKIKAGLEKFNKLLTKVEGICERREKEVDQLVKHLPTSEETISAFSKLDNELVMSVEKLLQERNFEKYVDPIESTVANENQSQTRAVRFP